MPDYWNRATTTGWCEAGVTRKQALLQQVYNVLRSEVDATRALLVEVLVVLLIVAEVVLALRSH
jgi:hypothetical protein